MRKQNGNYFDNRVTYEWFFKPSITLQGLGCFLWPLDCWMGKTSNMTKNIWFEDLNSVHLNAFHFVVLKSHKRHFNTVTCAWNPQRGFGEDDLSFLVWTWQHYHDTEVDHRFPVKLLGFHYLSFLLKKKHIVKATNVQFQMT